MTKSCWKLPYIPLFLFRKKFLKKNVINIRIKNGVIPYNFLKNNIKLYVFNGIWYLSLIMNLNMKGHKFGEFILTKKTDTQTH